MRHDHASARLAAACAASLAVLTACGSGDAATPAPAAAAEGSAVATALGAVEVPSQAQRVVALGDSPLDTALALGVQPVATLSSRGGTTV